VSLRAGVGAGPRGVEPNKHSRVRRKWLPWRRKAKLKDVDWFDVPDFGDDPIGLIILGIVLVPLIAILVLFLGEFLLLLLVLPLVMVARAVFGKPWTIEVSQQRRLLAAEQAKGWKQSGDRIQQIAKLLRIGGLPALHGSQPHYPSAPRP